MNWIFQPRHIIFTITIVTLNQCFQIFSVGNLKLFI